jgi:endoglucanase
LSVPQLGQCIAIAKSLLRGRKLGYDRRVRTLAVGVLTLTLIASAASSATRQGSATRRLSIRVVGNRFVDSYGKTVRLLGVNRASFQYACASGRGLSEGPTDAGAIAAMKAWHINVVRIPLNEACWLGLPTVKPQYGSQPYRDAVTGYVQRLHAAGLYVILDLHWSAPGSQPANGQQLMPDADHSPAFWSSVATTFKNDPAVLFDVYNEPRTLSWPCWRDGCMTPDGWLTAGMQSLVDAIRSTGAKQPIMLGGIGGAIWLHGWLTWMPKDPAHALVASFHIYNYPGYGCTQAGCWNYSLLPVAKRVPLVTGEMGEVDCAHDFIDTYMAWADAHGVSYLGWTWNVWDCRDGPALISDWSGTPTAFGVGLRDHLARLASAGHRARRE